MSGEREHLLELKLGALVALAGKESSAGASSLSDIDSKEDLVNLILVSRSARAAASSSGSGSGSGSGSSRPCAGAGKPTLTRPWNQILNGDTSTALKPQVGKSPSTARKLKVAIKKKKGKKEKKHVGTGKRGDPISYRLSKSSRPDVRTVVSWMFSPHGALCYSSVAVY